MQKMFSVLLLGFAHGIADATAAFILASFSHQLSVAEITSLILVYNLLAFGGQIGVGVALEKFKNIRLIFFIALVCLALATFVTTYSPIVAVILAGLGSALFHPSGGILTSSAANGRAGKLGIFASPGVLGLALGGFAGVADISALCRLVLPILLIAIGTIIYFRTPKLAHYCHPTNVSTNDNDAIVIILLCAIALRSAIWNLFEQQYVSNIETVLLLLIAAASGKFVGGFIADRVGWCKYAVCALLAAAPLLAFFGENLNALMLGIALLQSTTPVAWAAMLRLMPKQPGIATGLVLGLAILLGGVSFFINLHNSLIVFNLVAIVAIAYCWVLDMPKPPL